VTERCHSFATLRTTSERLFLSFWPWAKRRGRISSFFL